MKKRITDLEVERIDLVPRGANRKSFLLTKADEREEEEGMEPEIVKAVLETEMDDEKTVGEALTKAGLSEEASEAAMGALRLINAYKEQWPENVMGMLTELSGYELPVAKADKDRIEKLEAEVKNLKKEDEEKPEDKESILKEDGSLNMGAVPEEMRPYAEVVEKSRVESDKRAKDAIEKAEALEKDKMEKEYLAKAGELLNIDKAENLAPLLMDVAEKAPETSEKLEEMLKTANKRIEEGGLYGEVGSGRSGSGEATDKMESKAKEKMEKGDGKMTIQQARAEVLKEHPEYYDEHMNEKEAR